MATTRIVRHVTEALLAILRNDLVASSIAPTNIKAAPPESIEQINDSTLLLYLYQVVESPFLKNTGPTVVGIPPNSMIQKDALSLDLYYLLIPGAPVDLYLDTYDILGDAMRSFHDRGVFTLGDWVPTAELDPSETALQFRITVNRLEVENLFRVWEAINNPYRLSVSYVVRTVLIDSQLIEDRRLVSERRFDMEQK